MGRPKRAFSRTRRLFGGRARTDFQSFSLSVLHVQYIISRVLVRSSNIFILIFIFHFSAHCISPIDYEALELSASRALELSIYFQPPYVS
jgi:hypothetical protein